MTREEAITILSDIRSQYNCFDEAEQTYYHALSMAIQALREQKVGKWILVTNGRGGHECNLCHSYAPSYQNGSEHLSKFCCECGAKMEGADNE